MRQNIAENIDRLRSELPKGVELVAVSKFHPAEAVMEAYSAGQRVFGESRVAELLDKRSNLPGDIVWHFIGHLQTNKVKQLVGNVSLIESVDSLRLLELIDKVSADRGVTTEILMQVHVAAEETKFGWTPDELLAFFAKGRHRDLKATVIRGVMGMATNTDNTERIEADFKSIRSVFNRIAETAPELTGFNIVSMGMSDDFPIAIRHGATHVRIGSGIFGSRSN